MKYLVIIERGPNNLSAYVPDLPGCTSAGTTLAEVVAGIQEAIEGHIEVMPNPERRCRNRRANRCWWM